MRRNSHVREYFSCHRVLARQPTARFDSLDPSKARAANCAWHHCMPLLLITYLLSSLARSFFFLFSLPVDPMRGMWEWLFCSGILNSYFSVNTHSRSIRIDLPIPLYFQRSQCLIRWFLNIVIFQSPDKYQRRWKELHLDGSLHKATTWTSHHP